MAARPSIEPESILDFWFRDAAGDPARAHAREAVWFRGSDELDSEIRHRFGAAIEAAARGELAHWRDTARPALALVLVLDQFPRNVRRGTRRAFAQDPQALETARAAVSAGHLEKLAPFPGARHPLAVRDVVEAVATYFKKRPDELAARTRRRDVLVPRQLAMYLGHRYTGASLSVIGTALGRDHSAAANAVRVVERRILESAPLRYQVEALCSRLDGMVGAHRE